MSDRRPSAAQLLGLVLATCGLCALAAESIASEFPTEICAAAELSGSRTPERERLKLGANYGVAFSGGGSRSAAATIGQLRGLHRAGLLPSIDYFSAVSGGAWAAVPYTYYQGGEPGIETFVGLDLYRPPELLSDEDLESLPEGSFVKALGGVGFFVTRAPSALIRGKGNEIWSDIVGKELLAPFGLYDRRYLFAWDKPVGDFLTRLPQSEARHIPYLLVGGVIKCGPFGDRRILPLEISPLSTGVLPGVASDTRCPQSGYIPTYVFDNPPASTNDCPDNEQSYRIEHKKDLFTLSDALGITSSAPGLLVGKLMPFQTAVMKTPENWDNFKARDGGGLDNLGLLPLLSREVANITVFVNSKHPIEPDCSGKKCKWRKPVTSYFEVTGTKKTGFLGQESSGSVNSSIAGVFQGNGEELVKRLAAQKRAGKIPFHCGEFPLSETNQLKLPSTYKPRICWVYLDRTEEWVKQLEGAEDSLVHALKTQQRPYRDFPHYATFLSEGSRGQAADLDKKEILAMGQLTTWTVCEIAQDLVAGVEVGCSREVRVGE
ncbi:MAG: patatin-like phospholipase family protein [Acidobacteriota bacterium]|nr:patatin-like phospholipase family protein [Acidobacteriota bacterium]